MPKVQIKFKNGKTKTLLYSKSVHYPNAVKPCFSYERFLNSEKCWIDENISKEGIVLIKSIKIDGVEKIDEILNGYLNPPGVSLIIGGFYKNVSGQIIGPMGKTGDAIGYTERTRFQNTNWPYYCNGVSYTKSGFPLENSAKLISFEKEMTEKHFQKIKEKEEQEKIFKEVRKKELEIEKRITENLNSKNYSRQSNDDCSSNNHSSNDDCSSNDNWQNTYPYGPNGAIITHGWAKGYRREYGDNF